MQRARTPYQVLNVSPEAEPEVIEAAFKVLMKKYHPDKTTGGPPLAPAKAAEINEAFNILRDSERRARHDADEKARRAALASVQWAPQHRPPPPPPRRNNASRVAGGIAILLALAAVGGALLIVRQPSGAGASTIGASIRAAADEVQDAAGDALAGPALPVSERQVAEALVEYDRVQTLYGPIGVAAYSDACFKAQSRTRNLNDFDFCVAFDHAAGALEAGVGEPFGPPSSVRFTETQLDNRHGIVARQLPQAGDDIDERLSDIRALTYEAIADKVKADAPQTIPAPAARRATPPPARRPAAPYRPQPQRRAERPQQESDFLEREGGIY